MAMILPLRKRQFQFHPHDHVKNMISQFDANRVKPHIVAMHRRHYLTLCSLVVFTGCASIITELPEPQADALEAELTSQAVSAVMQQQVHLKRLSNVAGPVMTANAELCPKTRPYYGLSTHSNRSYPKQIRPVIQAELGISYLHVVFNVVPDGPAAEAGIMTGDLILDKNSQTVSAQDLRKWPIADHGRQDITIMRRSEKIDVTIETRPACDYKLGIRNSGVVNAIANGHSITVTTGMMDFTNDAELASIIGHELAHNTLGHIRKITANYILSLGGTRYTRPFESEADYVGLYYAARAGYDVKNVEDLWRRIGVHNPRSVGHAKTHPTTPDRYLRLKATYDEIQTKQAAGEPLIPNFKDKARAP